MAVQDYKINYKSDFVLNINGDAGWAVPFCIKFWTGMPSQAYFVGFDGVKYVNCRVGDTPTQLLVMFDDHHLPIGKLEMQIAYHTTIEEFPGSVFDEVTNARDVIVTIDGTDYQVMLDFTGEDAPELEFDLPAYANEAERIQNELQRQQNEADRIAAELQREQTTAAAVQGAENVNAQLNGTTLTVTNRQGVSTSVNTKGEHGEQGPVGPEGPQGETGISIVSFLPKSETATTLIYTITYSNGYTQDVAIPKGPKGDTGATGPVGPQGPQGQTGVSITGFVETGETETDTLYNITFSNGTTQQVSIPKGEKGDQGPVGPQGPQGPMGDVAVITPEQQAAFTMYSVPGQNTDGPMNQQATTNAMSVSETLDLSSLNTFKRSTDPSKKWKSTYYGTIIPVASGEVYDIIPQEGKEAIILPLKRASWVIGESYANDIATGFNDRVVVAVGTTYRFVVPGDCVCLFVQTTIRSGDITPTIIRRSTPSQVEDVVKYNDNLVSGKGIYEEGSVLMEPLVLKYSIQNFQLGADMCWYEFRATGNIRHSEVYAAHEGDVIQLTNNNKYAAWYAFLQGVSTIGNAKPCAPTTGRSILQPGESVTIVAPKNTAYLYVTSETSGEVQRPQMVKYVKVKDASPNLGFTVELKGNGMTVATARGVLKGGKTYRFSLDKTEWQKSSISTSDNVVFTISVRGEYIVRVTRDINPRNVYYVHVNEDSEFDIGYRGDVGESINISVNDVSKEFNKQIFDIHFVDNTTYMESMMVKVGNGDLVRYRINAASGSTPIKMYSRSVRDDAYLLDSISAAEDGIMEGEFMPAKYNYGLDYTDEVFVVIQSVKSEGFTPYFHVFNYGEPEYGKIVFPHQFIVKPEEKVVLFSTNDAGATSYDDGALNYAQIIPADGRYYMIYMGFGKTTHKSPNICFAYSDDGINWVKGIPEGIEPPIPGTNVIMDITNFSSMTGIDEFSGIAEVNNGCGICEVNDPVNRYRMICSVRNIPNPSSDPDGTIAGMCEYMLKSNDLVHWTCVKKITMKPHDSMPCLISYGDKIKAYIRMWDYTQPVDKRRMVGVMWLDIWGNVIVPDSGIGFRGEYNSAAVRISPNTDLLIPTHFWVNNDGTLMHGDDELESYIVDDGIIRYAPSYNLDRIKDRSGAEGAYSGWAYGPGLVSIGMQQYLLCKIGQGSHSVEVESSESQFCLFPIQWVTYDSYNTSGDVG